MATWDFPKMRGPNTDPKWYGSHFEDTHKKDAETAMPYSPYDHINSKPAVYQPNRNLETRILEP